MTKYISNYNKGIHKVLKSLVIVTGEYEKTLHWTICCNWNIWMVSMLKDFEKNALTPTGRYTTKDLWGTTSDRDTVFSITKILLDMGYIVGGSEKFNMENL